VRAPERLNATRVVAAPHALDDFPVLDGAAALRLAPDDLLIIGPGSYKAAWLGESSIQEKESGFVGWWLTPDELRDHVLPHVDWPLPIARPALAQGLVAGVPAKLWLTDDRALLLCAAAYAHELEERLR
jgi:acetyl-CoA acetyltransferase